MRILSRTFMLNVITVGNKGSSYADPVLVARKRLLKHKCNLSITLYIYNFLKQNYNFLKQNKFILQALKIFWKVFRVFYFSRRDKIENSELSSFLK